MTDDHRQDAPAAGRNRDPILDVLRRVLPASGLVLEIASGTGQHVVHFARALPALDWQPSEPDAGGRRSIAAWIAAEGVGNVRAPVEIDVAGGSWPIDAADAVVCINMIHIAPWAATPALMAGASRLLPEGGPLVLYGPFRRDGINTAPSNDRFDIDLKIRNAAWGIRDIADVAAEAEAAALRLDEVVEMPANNLTVVFRKAADA
jgi:SAM-dependent methyltransferase